MKFRQGFSGALLQQLGVGTNYRSPRLLAPQGGSMLVPHVAEGGGVSRGWPEGDLDGLPTPLVVLCAGGTCSTLLWLQGSSKVAVGFLHFVSFGSRIYPNCTVQAVIFSPNSFSVFC